MRRELFMIESAIHGSCSSELERQKKLIQCKKCRTPLHKDMINNRKLNPCTVCGAFVQADVFPARFRKMPVRTSGELLVEEKRAGCFYHPGKKAVIPCSSCGRFLCSLCDVELDNRHLCPYCLEAGKKTHKIRNLENHRILHDNIALSLAVYPILFVFPTIITAPMAIFISIRSWNSPTGIVPRTRIRYVLAVFFAVVQLVVWTAVIHNISS